MPGRTPAEAVTEILNLLQLAVSCVTASVLRPSGTGYRPGTVVHDIRFPRESPILAGNTPIVLKAKTWYRIVQGEDRAAWTITIEAYQYGLEEPDDGEIIAYHWHPQGPSAATTPHLHLGAGAEVGRRALMAAHLPTGRITLPDVVRLAVELGARPRRGDWGTVLTAARDALAAML